MRITIQGNFISIQIPENEGQPDVIQLPNSYSFEKIHIAALNNIRYLIPTMQISLNASYTFPPFNSKSPCCLKPYIIDISKSSEIKFYIEKFGQIPDRHYFDTAFTPILVTDDNGNEYHVISSDQFK